MEDARSGLSMRKLLLVKMNRLNDQLCHRRSATTMSQSPPVKRIKNQSRQVILLKKLRLLELAAAAEEALADELFEFETFIIFP